MNPFRIFIAVLLVQCLQTGSACAQLGILAVKAGLHTATLLNGNGERMTKQEILEENSSKPEKIGNSKILILRVKDADIKSKAKANIIALQARLDGYAQLYKSNQLIDIPKNDSDLQAIQDKDEKWNVSYYVNEINAYRRYAYQLKQKMLSAPAGNNAAAPATEAVVKDSAQGKG